jgi:hypothetical protein
VGGGEGPAVVGFGVGRGDIVGETEIVGLGVGSLGINPFPFPFENPLPPLADLPFLADFGK